MRRLPLPKHRPRHGSPGQGQRRGINTKRVWLKRRAASTRPVCDLCRIVQDIAANCCLMTVANGPPFAADKVTKLHPVG